MREPKNFKFSLVIRNDDYIVRDHRVHQVRLMPGVTFMDMILRSLQTKGFAPQDVELRNVLFMEPVATTDAYDRKVQIQVEWKGGHWLIAANSQKIVDQRPLDGKWDQNLQCELHLRQDTIAKTIDVQAMKQSALHEFDMDESYAFLRQVDINHYVFMKSLGRIYETTEGLLAQLHLSDLAQKYLKNFYLHPVYLDASTIIQAVILSRGIQQAGLSLAEIKPFIPMFIESFRAFTRLNETCYVYVREQTNLVASTKDILYYDIELYDENGNLAALFTRLAIKQIRSKALIQKLEAIGEQEAAAVTPPAVSAPVVQMQATAVPSAASMEQHLREKIANLLERHSREIDLEAGFYDQGLDSRHLLTLVQDLEGEFGQQLYPTLLFEYTNIRELAAYLSKEFGDSPLPLTAQPIVNTATAVTTVTAPVSIQVEPPVREIGGEALPLDLVIQTDLRGMIGALLEKRPEEVDPSTGFYDLGLDSRHLLTLVQDLEGKLGQQLYPTLLFEYTNIQELAGYLVREHSDSYRPQQSNAVQKAQQDDTTQTVFAHQVWEQAEVLKQSVQSQGPVLLFDLDSSLRDALQARLGSDQAVILVQPGSEYRETDTTGYEINPADAEQYARLLTSLQSRGFAITHVLHRWSQEAFATDEDRLTKQLQDGIYSLFFLTQTLLNLKLKEKTRILSLYESTPDQIHPQQAAVSGFAKGVQRENPRLQIKTVELRGETPLDPSRIAELLLQEWLLEDGVKVRYEKGQRYLKRLVESQAAANSTLNGEISLQAGGVYVITGGAGGLGLLFARYVAERVPAKLVLTGRSQLSVDKQRQLQQLEALGAEVLYVQSDIANRADAERLIRDVKARYGAVHGVIHSAGIVRDAFVTEKTKAEWDAVLAPKLQGTIWLDEALKNEPLDFFVLFSSIAVLGNVGQSDYAYANAFLDSFAERREAQRKAGERQGRTLSINWPLWKDGGMQIDEQGVKMMRERMGMAPLSNQKGLRAFETAYRLSTPQVIVLEGERERLLRGLGAKTKVSPTTPKSVTPAAQRPPVQATPVAPIAQATPVASKLRPAVSVREEEEIAIVGLSGRYPQARNVNEYWKNLKAGKDCITEIPADRWDWRKDFDPDKEARGKTYAKWGGFLDDIDKFDPLFFNISPLEAEFIDPQERLFLETVWETLEDAGCLRTSFTRQNVGVFVGVMWSQYQLFGAEEALRGNPMALGGNISSIANRVSYFFNFHGPSVALDTMCSSSLTSLHFACESIKRGECDVAIAGGVNLSLHPNKYLLLAQGKFAASDGRCRAFGEGGDGYVPGEGVGAVLLKPLSKAIADGDQIYGVVKATAINHGGKASGYYVPNPTSQGNVIADAMHKSGVDPRTVTYLEAHGTGTALGDPIEINGLMRAFAKAKDKQFCSIGSVKSNIGHLESAAGIAGLTKILLQMKHRQLVPSLHSETLNPNIPFEASPFRVQRELEEWKQPILVENGEAKAYPRRAGLSSFGAGGSNAHVIVEEYIVSTIPTNHQSQSPCIIPLSARNADRLHEYVRELQAYVAETLLETNSTASLADIAYTLQIGREKMEERVAFVSSSLQELHEQLTQYIGGQASVANVFSGNVRKGREKTELLIDGREGEQFLRIIVADKKLAKLAQLWVNGVDIDWSLLHPAPGQRLSLPTYPFAKERYWVPQGNSNQQSVAAAKLHPLVERNTSTLQEQKFTTRLTGDEFFLRDHVIQGQKLLPGVASLEMARVAGELSAERTVLAIKNVIWSAPVLADEEGVEVSISLYGAEEEAEFDVWSTDAYGERIVHASGLLAFAEGEQIEQPVVERIDVDAVIHRCSETIHAEEVYAGFARIGFAYGTGLRAIRELHSSEQEAMSRLELPAVLQAEFSQYVLHPALLDGVLQTVAGLLKRQAHAADGGQLPFAMGEVEICGPLPAACYAYVQLVSSQPSMSKFNIRLVSETGDVLVLVNEFAVKSLHHGEQDELMDLLQQIENGQLPAETADKMMEDMKR